MHKKKLAKRIIIPIVLVALIASAITIFVVKKKPKEQAPIVSPVTHQERNIELEIQEDVSNQKVCTEYNGNYIYKSIKDISFPKDTSETTKTLAYEFISGYSDKNSFLYFLNKQKRAKTENEFITLLNGKYTKTINSTKVSSGIYFGNLDKTYIYVENKKGNIEIDDSLYNIELEISQTAYWLDKPVIESPTKIYIREKYFFNEHSDNFIYITYVYEMIDLKSTATE